MRKPIKTKYAYRFFATAHLYTQDMAIRHLI